MIIKNVNLKPVNPKSDTLSTEQALGLRYAVVYNKTKVIALFDCDFWAKKFIDNTSNAYEFTIREVADD